MISQKIARFIIAHLPKACNYDLNYFQVILDDIERLSMEAMDKNYASFIVGDFDLSLERGDRGRIMNEFCQQFSMDIANVNTAQTDIYSWTFKS